MKQFTFDECFAVFAAVHARITADKEYIKNRIKLHEVGLAPAPADDLFTEEKLLEIAQLESALEKMGF